MNFHIVSDGACDLLPEYTKKHQVSIVPFYVSFDGETYLKELVDVDHDAFYKKMVDEHAIPKSSLPPVQDYVDTFTPLLEDKLPIICICITSKFSGSYNSALMARDLVLENNPDAKIAVIDSTLNTVTQGLYVHEAVKLRDKGCAYEEAVTMLENIKSTGRIFFTVGSMEYLVKNGRVGKLAVLAGDKLGIKPLIIMEQGEISLGGISRSRKKSKQGVLKLIREYFEKNKLSVKDYSFYVGTGFEYEEAEEFQKEFEESMNVKCEKAVQARIGTTVGCHTGPYPLGIGLIKKLSE